MSNWVSSLIQQQDGCLETVAQQTTQGRLRQEQLAQTVARRAAMPSQHDQVQHLRAQLAHREAQLEQVRAERDNHFIQEEEAHMRLLSSEAKRLEVQGNERSRTSALPRKRSRRTTCYRSTRNHG